MATGRSGGKVDRTPGGGGGRRGGIYPLFADLMLWAGSDAAGDVSGEAAVGEVGASPEVVAGDLGDASDHGGVASGAAHVEGSVAEFDGGFLLGAVLESLLGGAREVTGFHDVFGSRGLFWESEKCVRLTSLKKPPPYPPPLDGG